MLLNREHLIADPAENPEIRGHAPWMLCCFAALLVSVICYGVFQTSAPHGPSGGTFAGLSFGIFAAICMVLPAALTWRKHNPRRARYGNAQLWMKGHIWLGLLSLPLALFHTGFGWGGLLESWLMAVVLVVWFSGVYGLVLQQFLPSALFKGISAEAMAGHIDAVCNRLQKTADENMKRVCGSLFKEQAPRSEDLAPLRAFYLDTVRPYLAKGRKCLPGPMRLHSPAQAEALFEERRKTTDRDDLLDSLKALCNERRGLRVQQRLHGWLHGWLWVHIPLSMMLLSLLAVHVASVLMY